MPTQPGGSGVTPQSSQQQIQRVLTSPAYLHELERAESWSQAAPTPTFEVDRSQPIWPQYQTGYTPTYWENPQTVVRWKQAMDSFDATPDWIDRDALDYVYNYMQAINQDKPWTEWAHLDKNDPMRELLKQMPAPPAEMMFPTERRKYGATEQAPMQPGEYQPAAMQELGRVEHMGITDQVWESLPPWQQAMITTMASPVTAAGMGALPGAGIGFAVGGPLGALIGGVGGAAASLYAAKNPESGVAKALFFLDYPRQYLEQAIGFISQGVQAADPSGKYGTLDEFFQNYQAAWKAGRLTYETMQVDPTNLIAQLGGDQPAQPGEVWQLGVPEPVKVDAGDEYKTLYDIRQAIANGADPEEVFQFYSATYGLSAQFRELISGFILDPLNFTEYVTQPLGAGLAKIARRPGLAAAFEGTHGITAALREYGQTLRLTPVGELQDLTAFERWVGGLDSKGVPKVFTQESARQLTPLQRAGLWMFGLTPASRASNTVTNGGVNLALLLERAADDPAEMARFVRGVANTPTDMARELSMRTLESPDAAAIPLALRSFVPKVDEQLVVWESTAWQRTLLDNLAALTGRTKEETMAALANEQDAAVMLRQIINQATQAGDNPAAKAILAGMQKGELTAQSLTGMLKAFREQGVAYTPDMFRAQLYSSMMTHMAEWASDWFGVKPDHWIVRMGNMVKSAQSLVLLGLNPTYLINNALNNLVTMAAEGVFGLRSQADILAVWKQAGFTADTLPPRLRAGLGPAAEGLDLDIRAIREATRAGDKLDAATDAFKRASHKLGVFTTMSGKMEQWSSAQAMTAGFTQAMARTWTRGRGFDRMPMQLERALSAIDQGLPDLVYSAIEGGMNQKDIESALWGAVSRRGVDAFIPDVAQAMGMSGGDARELLMMTGVYDLLKEKLTGDLTDNQVRAAFDDARQQIETKLGEAFTEKLEHDAESARVRTETEGVQAAIDIYDQIEQKITDRWLENFDDWEETFTKALTMEKETKALLVRATQRKETEAWNNLWAQVEANYLGVGRALGLDSEVSRQFMGGLVDDIQTWKDFHKARWEKLETFFNTDFDTREASWAAWRALQDELDEMYFQAHTASKGINEKLDGVFATLMGQTDPAKGERAAAWRKGVRDLRDTMVTDMRAFRKSVQDMPLDEQNMGVGYQEWKLKQWRGFLDETYRPQILERMRLNREGIRSVAGEEGGAPPIQEPPVTPPPPEPAAIEQPVVPAVAVQPPGPPAPEATGEAFGDAVRKAVFGTPEEQRAVLGDFPKLNDPAVLPHREYSRLYKTVVRARAVMDQIYAFEWDKLPDDTRAAMVDGLEWVRNEGQAAGQPRQVTQAEQTVSGEVVATAGKSSPVYENLKGLVWYGTDGQRYYGATAIDKAVGAIETGAVGKRSEIINRIMNWAWDRARNSDAVRRVFGYDIDTSTLAQIPGEARQQIESLGGAWPERAGELLDDAQARLAGEYERMVTYYDGEIPQEMLGRYLLISDQLDTLREQNPPVEAVYRGPERRELLELREEVDQLKAENERVKAENKGLKNDPLLQIPLYHVFENGPEWAGKKVLALDVQGLKWVNDTFGEESGNALLKGVAAAAKEAGIDIYRVAGDEFAAPYDDLAKAQAAAQQLQNTLRESIITVEESDGSIHLYKGFEAYAGWGDDFKKAYAGVNDSKRLWKEQHPDFQRGGKPPKVTEVTPRGEGAGGNAAIGQEVQPAAEVAAAPQIRPLVPDNGRVPEELTGRNLSNWLGAVMGIFTSDERGQYIPKSDLVLRNFLNGEWQQINIDRTGAWGHEPLRSLDDMTPELGNQLLKRWIDRATLQHIEEMNARWDALEAQQPKPAELPVEPFVSMNDVQRITTDLIQEKARLKTIVDGWQAKVSRATDKTLALPEGNYRGMVRDGLVRVMGVSEEQAGAWLDVYDARAQAWAALTGRPADEWYVENFKGFAEGKDISPERGQRLLQDVDGGAKAGVTFDQAGRAVMLAMQGPDFSSVVHETGHIFRRDLYRSLAQIADETRRADVKADIQAVEGWLTAEVEKMNALAAQGKLGQARRKSFFVDSEGNPVESIRALEDNGEWTRAGDELFARAFEKYVAEGKAPNTGLQRVFDLFKQWMLRIYTSLVGNALEVGLTDEVRGVFDRMLAEDVTTDAHRWTQIRAGEKAGQGVMFGAGEDMPLFSGTAMRGEMPTPRETGVVTPPILPGMEDVYAPQMRGAVEGGTAEGAGPMFAKPAATNQPDTDWFKTDDGAKRVLFQEAEGPVVQDGDGTLHLESLNGPAPDAERMPLHTADQQPTPPIQEMQQQGWQQLVKPMVNMLESKLTSPEARQNTSLVGANLDPVSQKAVRQYLHEVYGQLADTKLAAVRWSENRRDAALLNYSKRTGLDGWLGAVIPYQFFYTRSMAEWGLRFIDRPAWLAQWARMRAFQQKFAEKGFPSRLKGKFKIPVPFLPEWAGGGVYIDPMRIGFPFEQLLRPITQLVEQNDMRASRAEYILQRWVNDETVSAGEAQAAAKNHQGPVWDRALAAAANEIDGEISNPWDFVNLMFSPSLPIDIAVKTLRGQPEKINQLPITRQFQAVSALAGANQGRGYNLEGPLRRLFGVPERGEFEDYRVDRMLANMAAEGVISAVEAERAMIDHSGQAYADAQARVAKGGAVTTLGSFVGADLFPEGEAEQRSLKAEFDRALAARDAGDTKAVTAFFDKYPEYEARMMLMQENPDERLRSFLVGQVWDNYLKLPDLYKRQMKEQLGDLFNDRFINKQTRNYASIDIQSLAMWAKLMGGVVPETAPESPYFPLKLAEPAVAGVYQGYVNQKEKLFPNIGQQFKLPEEAQNKELVDAYYQWRNKYLAQHPEIIPYVTGEDSKLAGAKPEVAALYYQFQMLRDQHFPKIYDIQDGYFQQPEGAARKQYLAQHPELAGYWDWRREYMRQFPEVIPYLMSTESLMNAVLGESRSTSSGSQSSTRSYSGGTRSSGTRTSSTYTAQPQARPVLTVSELRQFSPALISQLQGYYFGGVELMQGALSELERLYNASGRKASGQSLEEYINTVVKASFVSP